jgi:hypothetical protein
MGGGTKMEVNEITFYTVDAYKNTIEEPKPCYKNIPEWYARTSKNNRKSGNCPFKSMVANPAPKTNIKTCPAIFDYLTTGYIIPSWDNFIFRNIENSLAVNWERDCMHEDSAYKIFGTHPTEHQIDGMIKTEEKLLYGGFHKILSPWFVKTPPGISLYLTNPSQYRDKRFTSVDAVIHPDENPISLQWFFEWNQPIVETTLDNPDFSLIDVKNQVIKLGTPLMLIIPFRREHIKYNVEYLTKERYNSTVIQPSKRYTQDWFGDNMYNKFRKNIGRLFR